MSACRGFYQKSKKMKKRITGIVLSAAVFIGYRFLPVPQGLEMSGMQTLALLIIAILLWVTEAMPLGISSIFVLVLPMFFGLATMKDFLVAFPNPTLFFVLARAPVFFHSAWQ